jgi:hypothetical protein
MGPPDRADANFGRGVDAITASRENPGTGSSAPWWAATSASALYDVCSIARDDGREGVVARFAVVRRERMQSRR